MLAHTFVLAIRTALWSAPVVSRCLNATLRGDPVKIRPFHLSQEEGRIKQIRLLPSFDCPVFILQAGFKPTSVFPIAALVHCSSNR